MIPVDFEDDAKDELMVLSREEQIAALTAIESLRRGDTTGEPLGPHERVEQSDCRKIFYSPYRRPKFYDRIVFRFDPSLDDPQKIKIIAID